MLWTEKNLILLVVWLFVSIVYNSKWGIIKTYNCVIKQPDVSILCTMLVVRLYNCTEVVE